ncbi:hypothetical protein AGMMS49975_09920 [Clostridia bacterium]|nr:hypothetical protein AGMMS49975_09920 [Clostridia bacterium]
MTYSVGIDLGTTFSAVAIVDEATRMPRIVNNGEGAKITPSVIQFIDGVPRFGTEAESAFNAGELGCVATFKRGMGSGKPYCYIDGKAYTSEELSAMLLRHLKEEAEAELGGKIKDAVITVPAYFYSLEREATLRAAESAGLSVKKIIDEPNAAAMAYSLSHWRENANILVYDLGGGTFDVTLVKMGHDGELFTVTTRGNHELGGRDWDGRLESILHAKFQEELNEETRADISTISYVKGLAKGVKKSLSARESVKVDATLPNFGRCSVTITREDFEKCTADLIERTGDLCRAVLGESKLDASNITDILLVGGSTRMPQVSRFIANIFGKKPIAHVNPDEAVALGAAIQATKTATAYFDLSVKVEDGKKVTDRKDLSDNFLSSVKSEKKLSDVGLLSIKETVAHAMGIIAVNDDTNMYYNEIIIPANHPRPVRSAKKFKFYTSKHSSNEIEIYVLQGSSENPVDCKIPYKYVVTGIRHVKNGDTRGTLVRIQYSYDDNGIIHIQARQEDDKTDLTIRKDAVPTDISKYGKSVEKETRDVPASFLGLQTGRSANQDVVHKFKAVTFSNVEWSNYDNISSHPSGAKYNEPKVHVKANEKAIEFHGYNISAMDEGVYYTLGNDDDFEIECDIDTSDIKPHPGGNVNITLGIIRASLSLNGGDMFLDGTPVATVGSRFTLKMSLSHGGHYEIYIDDKLVGSKDKPDERNVDVRFGLEHGGHHCELLSHAYISNINMRQRANEDSENSETETWGDE